MAVVRITGYTRRAIVCTLESTFQAERDNVKKSIRKSLGKAIYNRAIGGKLISQISVIPDAFLKMRSGFTLTKIGNRKAILNLYMQEHRPIPNDNLRIPDTGATINFSGITLPTLNPPDSLYKEIYAILDILDDITSREEQTMCTITAMLNSATSVNAIVKQWPQIYELLPEDIRDRIDLKVQRRARVKLELEKNSLETMTTHVVKHKLIGTLK